MKQSVQTPGAGRSGGCGRQLELWAVGTVECQPCRLDPPPRRRPGETVAVYANRSAPLILGLLGILRAGAAFCILNPAQPAPRLVNCIRGARPRAWLQVPGADEPPEDVQRALAELAGDRHLILPAAEEERSIPELSGDWNPEIDVAPNSPAYLTFTSGSTGEPKCILGTHQPLSHFLEWHIAEFGLKQEDRFSLLSGLGHDPLLRDVFTPLWLGATLCIPPADDILSPGRLREWMRSRRITVAHLTPAMGDVLTAPSGKSEPLSTLRYVFFGGELLSSRRVNRLRQVAPLADCVNFYGTTETPQAMAWHRIETTDESSGVGPAAAGTSAIPLGRAIPDAQLLILNRAQGLAGPGELGEIFVRTPYLSLDM